MKAKEGSKREEKAESPKKEARESKQEARVAKPFSAPKAQPTPKIIKTRSYD